VSWRDAERVSLNLSHHRSITVEYQVKVYGYVAMTYRLKEDAIKDAESQPEHTEPQVIAHEVSGTYESHTCIWPVRGETYSR